MPLFIAIEVILQAEPGCKRWQPSYNSFYFSSILDTSFAFHLLLLLFETWGHWYQMNTKNKFNKAVEEKCLPQREWYSVPHKTSLTNAEFWTILNRLKEPFQIEEKGWNCKLCRNEQQWEYYVTYQVRCTWRRITLYSPKCIVYMRDKITNKWTKYLTQEARQKHQNIPNKNRKE